MKFVNLIIGQKRNLMSNLESISNCQVKSFKNINFFIFWDEDNLTNSEKLFLKKKYKNTYFHSVKSKNFKIKINNILKKKYYSNEIRHILIGTFLQYSLLKYAFDFAVKKLKYKNYKKFFWQRIRSDTYIKDNINGIFKKNTLYLPGTVHGYGFIDFHAIGSFNEFKVYSNTIDTITKLYKLNIFMPPEIALRMHLTKFNTKCILSAKLPAALLENAKKYKLRHFLTLRGNKYLKNYYSHNITEEGFRFMNNFILRKLYYYVYNNIIKIKLILRN